MAPDRNDEYLYYQSLLGAYPADLLTPASAGQEAPAEFIDRLRQFMHKAIKEAKRHTSWVSANAPYEEAVSRFVESTLSGKGGRAFLAQFVPFAAAVSRLAVVNSLAQLTLKIASPGVADIYQGSELWNTSLADPDNRRPVDFDQRRVLLDELRPSLRRVGGWIDGKAGDAPTDADASLEPLAADWLEHWTDGRLKLFITACGLQLRRAWPALLLHGEYHVLPSTGKHDGNVIALARERDGRSVVAVAPRLMTADHGDGVPTGVDAWGDTAIVLPQASGGWRNLLTGAMVTPAGNASATSVAAILWSCPVALLWRERA
jgi:(1->4)-alpha-D-glucan 1-alpha-D-glucosylmutase